MTKWTICGTTFSQSSKFEPFFSVFCATTLLQYVNIEQKVTWSSSDTDITLHLNESVWFAVCSQDPWDGAVCYKVNQLWGELSSLRKGANNNERVTLTLSSASRALWLLALRWITFHENSSKFKSHFFFSCLVCLSSLDHLLRTARADRPPVTEAVIIHTTIHIVILQRHPDAISLYRRISDCWACFICILCLVSKYQDSLFPRLFSPVCSTGIFWNKYMFS